MQGGTGRWGLKSNVPISLDGAHIAKDVFVPLNIRSQLLKVGGLQYRIDYNITTLEGELQYRQHRDRLLKDIGQAIPQHTMS